MKNLPVLLLLFIVAACGQGNGKTPKEPVHLGLNGKLRAVEITYYNESGAVEKIEDYTFDDNGNLLERLGYNGPVKKDLAEKDTYKRDSDGSVIEIYKGFNLWDPHYIAESLWRRIEDGDGKEKWEKIEDSFWGTAYEDVTYDGDRKITEHYSIQKKNGEKSSVNKRTETLNNRGQVVSVTTESGEKSPKYTTTWTYNVQGHLLKEESTTVFPDGDVKTMVDAVYTVNEVDDRKNPLKVTDGNGKSKAYKYTYRD